MLFHSLELRKWYSFYYQNSCTIWHDWFSCQNPNSLWKKLDITSKLSEGVLQLHTKETIYWTKGQIILTNVDTKTNSPFQNMITRTKSYVFTKIFLAVFSLESTFWHGLLMFCIIWFSKQKSSSSKQRFHWRILWGIFLVKTEQKWRHPFVRILLHYNFFIIRYIFWLKIMVRHETLSIKT